MTISPVRFSSWYSWNKASTPTTEKTDSPTVSPTASENSYSGDEKPKSRKAKAATPLSSGNDHKATMRKAQPRRRFYPAKGIAAPLHSG
jgi:hypothetical protein